mmetsp:Transcript_14698/g.41362  ORF Transcript_14698/g.41362 Transcript_14698/m.41362 type:complete len:208 (+) Transcript_14698:1485-2108(+)
MSAHHINLELTGHVEAVVKAVVLVLAVLELADLLLAGFAHAALLQVLFKTLDHQSMSVRHLTAEKGDLGFAGLLHWVLEVDVLAHAHLLVEKRGAALIAQALSLVLEATDHPSAARFDMFAELGAVLKACIGKGNIEPNVLAAKGNQVLSATLAVRVHDFVTVVHKAVDHASIVASNAVQRLLLIPTDLLNVVAAELSKLGVKAEVN